MNFIKTSKFSVKGIDTTRYILTSEFCEEESPIQSKGLKDPLRTTPKKNLNPFGVELEEGTFPSSIEKRRLLVAIAPRSDRGMFFQGES